MNDKKRIAIASAVSFVLGIGAGQMIPRTTADSASPETQYAASRPDMSHAEPHGDAHGAQAEGDACQMDCQKDRPQLEARIKANPNDAEALIELGACDVVMGDTRSGLDRLSKGSVLTNDPALLTRAGTAFSQVAESEKAVAAFEKALLDDPRNSEALYRAGLVSFHNIGDKKKAVHYWTKYLAVAPDAPNAEMIRRAVEHLSEEGGTSR